MTTPVTDHSSLIPMIEAGWEARASVDASTGGHLRDAVAMALVELDAGRLRNSGRSPYRRLDPGLVVETIGQLQARIEARFPRSELAGVCAELQRLGEESRRRARSFARPNWLLRLAVLVVMAGALAVIGLVGLELDLDPGTRNLFSLIPSIDAFFNVTVLVGATCFSLFTIEARLIRARAATALRPLRAIIHVIDMHQLTKDPSVDGVAHPATPVSPPHDLT
eukprot:gene20029-20559_t